MFKQKLRYKEINKIREIDSCKIIIEICWNIWRNQDFGSKRNSNHLWRYIDRSFELFRVLATKKCRLRCGDFHYIIIIWNDYDGGWKWWRICGKSIKFIG